MAAENLRIQSLTTTANGHSAYRTAKKSSRKIDEAF